MRGEHQYRIGGKRDTVNGKAGFKGLSVVLVVGPERLLMWSVTKSDMSIPNLPLRSYKSRN